MAGKVKTTPRSGRKSRRKGTKMELVVQSRTAPAGGGVIIRNPKQSPMVQTTNKGVMICNTEVFSITTSGTAGAFVLNAGALIPGNATSFPWLSSIASGYAKWRWNRMRMIYIPATPTTTPGTITMAFSYDYTDAALTTVQQAQVMYGSVTAPVWAGWEGSSQLHSWGNDVNAVFTDLDCTRFGSGNADTWYRYITFARFTALIDPDKNNYAPAQILIVSNGGPAVGASYGYIFCHYEIELIEPVSQTINQ
nr:MAG: putative coat protein [Procedovirinae sp.]